MLTSFAPPKIQLLSQILPSEPLLLMGAGPVPIPHAVAQANSVVINHLGDTMNKVVDNVKVLAQYAFQTRSPYVMGVAGPSSAAMEMGITNLLWKGKKALVLENGTFSNRLGQMASGVGADVTRIIAKEPSPLKLDEIKKALESEKYDLVTLVQGETSCGVYNAQLKKIAQLCKANGALVLVDAVCTLSTMPLKMDDWGLDVVITGGQKGVSSIPGVSLIAFSKDAWDVIEKRGKTGPHWCLSALGSFEFWGNHDYHYTAPVPGILAMHEALRLICEETLAQRFIRHKQSSLALQEGLEKMGLELYVPKEYRLNSVVAINMPKGIDGYQVRSYMAEKFNVEISGAFGLEIIRIGQMGEQCRSHNLFRTLHALGMAFRNEGYKVNLSAGMAAMEEFLARDSDEIILL
ncbi:MAG: alanine--glyoxylate aminotransferase family protein [SAR324 cluster bacterium]|nr:alanine--glyoxylate aminotransferase family protein [SAR324 cluster bacterium]